MQSAVAVVIGGLLALLASFGLVSSQSGVPEVVTTPYVTYDS